jgi:hypothetical protein
MAATWYVDGNNGLDTNDCKTPQMACVTIGHAISLAASGDSIRIAAATYQEALSVPFSLTFIGASAATTIVDANGSDTFMPVFSISNTSAHVSVSNLTMQHGYAPVRGGGVYNVGTLTISNSVVTLNAAFHGGAIYNGGTATIRNTIVTSNGTDGTHQASCGAIENRGAMTITNSTLAGNSNAPTNYTWGGAICNYSGVMTINGSTLSGNTSNGVNYGGGGAIYNQTTLAINNSTFFGNTASGGGYGGGAIYNSGGTVKIASSTFSGNTTAAQQGGGITNAGGTVTLQDTIIANSSTGGNCAGTMTSNGYNLSSDSTCSFSASGDRNNINPRLGPLQNNGGPTQTMALPSGSPAIDAGNPTGCKGTSGQLLTTDQRGKPRYDPEDTRGCDMGAYERQSD